MFQGNRSGALLMVIAAMLFAVSDLANKDLSTTFPVIVLILLRNAIQIALTFAWRLKTAGPRRALRTEHLRAQLFRALLFFGVSVLTFKGVKALPLAEYTAFVMIHPIVTIVLAKLFFAERIGLARNVALFFGFLGMLLVVRPGSGAVGFAVFYPLGAAVLFSLSQVISSRMTERDDAATTNFYTAVFAVGASLAWLGLTGGSVGPQLVAAVEPNRLVMILILGVCATIAQICLVGAVRHAPLSKTAPLSYLQIAFAAILGWLSFGHVPDTPAAVGMCLIACSGIATAVVRYLHGSRTQARTG
jgi:drug/metabolite transporter (DMT)-like permease